MLRPVSPMRLRWEAAICGSFRHRRAISSWASQAVENEHVDVSVGSLLQVIAHIEPGSPHHSDAAKTWVGGPGTNHLRDPLVTEELGDARDELDEETMEGGIGPSARRRRCGCVVIDTPIRLLSLLLR